MDKLHNWNKIQIDNYRKAANQLDAIMRQVFNLIASQKENITEYEVSEFILNEFRSRGLKTDKSRPIVAFGSNTSFVHYFPDKNSAKLEPNSPIMIDIWARLGQKEAPFADITSYGYFGKTVTSKVQRMFDNVIESRDLAIDFIVSKVGKNELPTGQEIDSVVRNYFKKRGLSEKFLHSTGHSLGFGSPHGRLAGLRRTNTKLLKQNVGYTIEPGLYFQGEFGARSEIDFLINEKFEVEISTKIQKEIILIN